MGSCWEIETGLPSITQRVTKLQNCDVAPKASAAPGSAMFLRQLAGEVLEKIVLRLVVERYLRRFFGFSVRFNRPDLRNIREGLRRF